MGPDDGFNVFATAVGINLPDAFWISGGNRAIASSYAFEEIAVGFFDAVAHERERSLAGEQALGTDFVGDEHEQGEVGAGVPDGQINHLLHEVQIESAAIALVSGGRVVEPIAQDEFAGGQGGANDPG